MAVTQWGASDAAGPRPRVMLGSNNLRNFLLSGIALRYAMFSGRTFYVDPSRLQWPIQAEGLVLGLLKGLWGQRILCK